MKNEDDNSSSLDSSDEDVPRGDDAERVWSSDIEQSFQEALAIYPPCGRRKIILSDEGKMYGRNELIARYIKLRTGKHRSRKQVSSHIQVLARKKAREIKNNLKTTDNPSNREIALQAIATMSSAQIVSASALFSNLVSTKPTLSTSGAKATAQPVNASGQQPMEIAAPSSELYPNQVSMPTTSSTGYELGNNGNANNLKMWPSRNSNDATNLRNNQKLMNMEPVCSSSINRKTLPDSKEAVRSAINNGGESNKSGAITGHNIKLQEFSAFLTSKIESEPRKHHFVRIGQSNDLKNIESIDIQQILDKFPDGQNGLKDLYSKGPPDAFYLVKFWGDMNITIPEEGAFYGVSSCYESEKQMKILISSKVCSFGKQVVEKVEGEHGSYENGKYVYQATDSPWCDYLITFIGKLRSLPEKYMMNSVLENFTVLQVVINQETKETLLCIAYIFEVSSGDHGTQHRVYRLVMG
ncbi:Transcriptional enhancer factor TEF-5 [Trichoplax sp. H2]|nr:Transcriptional enhancer factor TEF-5 [Trichoplax sp. H2]|eukprot:RDD45826.1 Transcriptional enhancer factor TEF-5 [Trichoplax sp. H2]